MKADEKMPQIIVGEHFLSDSAQRLEYQQQFSAAGFKTLILMNGGALVALLTYAGNSSGRVTAPNLATAFYAYVAGLILAALAHLSAYLSQAAFMNDSLLEAYRQLGLEVKNALPRETYRTRGNWAIGIGIALLVGSLICFIAGCYGAMSAL